MKNKKELAIISTLLLTDGGLSKISKNRWEIFVTSKSKEISELFSKTIKKLNKNKPVSKIENKNGVVKTRICDLELGEDLLELSLVLGRGLVIIIQSVRC